MIQAFATWVSRAVAENVELELGFLAHEYYAGIFSTCPGLILSGSLN